MILLLPFLGLALLIIITPGPDMTLVTRNALKSGRRSAIVTPLGTVTGLLIWTASAAIGIAALLEANAFAFTVVKLAGAAYLGYLGIRALVTGWRNGHRVEIPENHLSAVRVNSPYGQGLLTNILNPKIAILFTSLIPQFIVPGTSSAALDSLELASVFVVMGLVWLTAFSIFVGSAGNLIRFPKVKKALDTLTGIVLIGLGVKVLAETIAANLPDLP